MKILIADEFKKDYLNEISKLGYDVSYCPNVNSEELLSYIDNIDIIIVRSTKINCDIIRSSNKLKLIIRAGSGYDTIDIKTAREMNIHVCNVPGANSIAVAELTIGLILSIDRRIFDNIFDLKNNKWNKLEYSKSDGIFGKTLGIIGLGKIGQAVAYRAMSFGLNIVVFDNDNSMKNNFKNFTFVENLYEIAKLSDIITLHIPSNESNKNIINKQFLSLVKNNAIIINTSRGNLINEKDLLDYIKIKNIRVGLDVYNNEPKEKIGTFFSEIIKHTNVYGTHHIGASTQQAQNSIAIGVIKILDAFKYGKIINKVN